MPKLYRVEVAFEFIALAEDAAEAESYAYDATCDMSDIAEHARARPMRNAQGRHTYPQGWNEDCLVYGAEKDVTVKQAIAIEEADNECSASHE